MYNSLLEFHPEQTKNKTTDMGFFSFFTQDTHESIPNTFSNRPTFPVTMADDKGNTWVENDYEGYGVFGGKDYYELLDEMNRDTNRS